MNNLNLEQELLYAEKQIQANADITLTNFQRSFNNKTRLQSDKEAITYLENKVIKLEQLYRQLMDKFETIEHALKEYVGV